jgi:hypothetical protein
MTLSTVSDKTTLTDLIPTDQINELIKTLIFKENLSSLIAGLADADIGLIPIAEFHPSDFHSIELEEIMSGLYSDADEDQMEVVVIVTSQIQFKIPNYDHDKFRYVYRMRLMVDFEITMTDKIEYTVSLSHASIEGLLPPVMVIEFVYLDEDEEKLSTIENINPIFSAKEF